MIYYFSGTGNSRFVSQKLAEILEEECRIITDVNPSTEIAAGQYLGFVFPVYSWGVPPVMLDFINRLPQSLKEIVNIGQMPVWCVMTCGDETAMAPEMFQRCVESNGMKLDSIWSVIMPNNYVLLPGFDVDTRAIEEEKIKKAPARIKEIAEGIRQHMKVVDVTRGNMAWIKTKGVYPLFKKWGINTKKWSSSGTCVSCGICAKACPMKNIVMKEGRPEWGPDCCSCLACYHSCPRHAVRYSSKTDKKGQYFLPDKHEKSKPSE